MQKNHPDLAEQKPMLNIKKTHPLIQDDQSSPQLNLDENLETQKFLQWIIKNRKKIAYGVVALILLFVLVYKYSGYYTNETEKVYLQASTEFTNLAKANQLNDTHAEVLLKNLTNLIDEHPDLQPVYDGSLGQLLLNRDSVLEATPFVTRTIKRVEVNALPYYEEYASITLLISSQYYQEALDRSYALQEKMGKAINEYSNDFQRLFGEELFAVNLFRVAVLQQQLGHHPEELRSWQLWKLYAGLAVSQNPLPVRVNSQAFRSVIQGLAIGDVSLPDYIAYRQSILSK